MQAAISLFPPLSATEKLTHTMLVCVPLLSDSLAAFPFFVHVCVCFVLVVVTVEVGGDRTAASPKGVSVHK